METKKRSVNFTGQEESLLMSLVKEYAKVIECKVSDTNMNTEKGKCWRLIEQKFNSINSGSYRNQIVLKKKYDNIKKRAKKKFADEKAQTFATGGGPSQEIKMTDVDMQAQEILGTRIKGTRSEFDADCETQTAVVENNPENSITFMDDIFMQNIDDDNNGSEKENNDSNNDNNDSANENNTEQAEVHNDWSKYTPTMLRTKKSKVLTTQQSKEIPPRRHKSVVAISERVSQWAQAKEAIELSRTKHVQDQEEFRLQAMKEKHELEMELMRKRAEAELGHMKGKADAELAFMQKEHEGRMIYIKKIR